MKSLQDPVGLRMAWCDSLVMDVELVQEGIEVDLPKLGTIVRCNFPHVWSCGEDFHDCHLDALGTLGVYRFGPGVLGS